MRRFLIPYSTAGLRGSCEEFKFDFYHPFFFPPRPDPFSRPNNKIKNSGPTGYVYLRRNGGIIMGKKNAEHSARSRIGARLTTRSDSDSLSAARIVPAVIPLPWRCRSEFFSRSESPETHSARFALSFSRRSITFACTGQTFIPTGVKALSYNSENTPFNNILY